MSEVTFRMFFIEASSRVVGSFDFDFEGFFEKLFAKHERYVQRELIGPFQDRIDNCKTAEEEEGAWTTLSDMDEANDSAKEILKTVQKNVLEGEVEVYFADTGFSHSASVKLNGVVMYADTLFIAPEDTGFIDRSCDSNWRDKEEPRIVMALQNSIKCTFEAVRQGVSRKIRALEREWAYSKEDLLR